MMDNFRSEKISCQPISNLAELLDWPRIRLTRRAYRVRFLPLGETRANTDQPRVIVCHDMANNYHEDRYFQGSNHAATCYNFYHWELIDYFIYFSHHMVTIPPESWINAAHANNVRMLGCFITEFKRGEAIWNEIETRSDEDMLDRVVKSLVDITVFYGFDGWLLNIENKIDRVDLLRLFVEKLRNELRKIDPDLYKVIWYDSVTVNGDLKWQNELNELNAPFFDITDGIFLNYTWKPANLSQSRVNAGKRFRDVYVGVDVFGRGCMGGGGFDCNVAFDEIFKHGLSVALFAPGWVYETLPSSDFLSNNEKFWYLLVSYLSTRRKRTRLALTTAFTHGCGRQFFVSGREVSFGKGWANFNLQSPMPVISSQLSSADWCFQDAYFGGNSLIIRPNRELFLFEFDVDLSVGAKFRVDYAFKDENESERRSADSFVLALKYEINSESSVKNVCAGSSDSALEVMKTIESAKLDETQWQKRSIFYVVRSSIKLISISALNRYEESSEKSIKLGYLKLNELSSENLIEQIVPDLKIEWQTQLFRIEGNTYMTLRLNWTEQTGWYFNVFVDSHRYFEKAKKSDEDVKGEEDEPFEINSDLKYVGSTQIPNFVVCLHLNDQVWLDPTLECDSAPLAFYVVVEPVREIPSSRIRPAESIKNMANFHNVVLVKEDRVKQNNDAKKNPKFFENLVDDFECFL